jgi:bifunctional NMN adenylyltransferase/nudix hydrolase
MAPSVRRAREQDICVFIGRFQPLHSGHLAVIMAALEYAEFLILVVGSAYQPRRPDANPFFFQERVQMILAALPREVRERVIIIPQADSNYDVSAWNADVYRAVNEKARLIRDNAKISLIGHAKDHTSYYLKLFPQWSSIDVASARELDATVLRNHYFDPDPDAVDAMFRQTLDRQDLPVGVVNWLREFQKTDAYAEQVDEMEFYRAAHARWARESFPTCRTTVTGDALIEQADWVLLIQRDQYPQKGTWAMPGGHLENNETVQDCALREGYEETGIAVPKLIFERSLIGQDYFDEPRRDPRGRYITHTFYYRLNPPAPSYDPRKSAVENRARIERALDLPEVRGLDDARDAKWWHKSEIDTPAMRSQMFLDHAAIINKMIAKYKDVG